MIDAWAAVSSTDAGAAERAEALLDRLDELHRGDPELKPTVACYRGVMAAWARSSRPDGGLRATAVLDRLEQQPGLSPIRSCYYHALTAIGKSDDPNKARAAFDMLRRMKESFAGGNRLAEPSVPEYATAIRSMGSTAGSFEEKDKAYRFVEAALVDFMRGAEARAGQAPGPRHPDEYEQLYLQYLWAAFRLLRPGGRRDEAVRGAMRQCPRDVLARSSVQLAVAKVTSWHARGAILEQEGQSRRADGP
jgi:hypothetical protein